MSTVTDMVHKKSYYKNSGKVTGILCNKRGTSWDNAPESIDINQFETILGDTILPDTLVGFALNGVPIVQNLTKDGNKDILYPLEIGGDDRPDKLELDI